MHTKKLVWHNRGIHKKEIDRTNSSTTYLLIESFYSFVNYFKITKLSVEVLFRNVYFFAFLNSESTSPSHSYSFWSLIWVLEYSPAFTNLPIAHAIWISLWTKAQSFCEKFGKKEKRERHREWMKLINIRHTSVRVFQLCKWVTSWNRPNREWSSIQMQVQTNIIKIRTAIRLNGMHELMSDCFYLTAAPVFLKIVEDRRTGMVFACLIWIVFFLEFFKATLIGALAVSSRGDEEFLAFIGLNWLHDRRIVIWDLLHNDRLRFFLLNSGFRIGYSARLEKAILTGRWLHRIDVAVHANSAGLDFREIIPIVCNFRTACPSLFRIVEHRLSCLEAARGSSVLAI